MAALCLYSAVDFYREQNERNSQTPDPFQAAAQQRRFAPLKEATPPDAKLGYVSDVPPNPAIILGAAYALAPRLVVSDASPHQFVLGNFTRPQDYAAFGRARGLEVVQEFPHGVILYKKAR